MIKLHKLNYTGGRWTTSETLTSFGLLYWTQPMYSSFCIYTQISIKGQIIKWSKQCECPVFVIYIHKIQKTRFQKSVNTVFLFRYHSISACAWSTMSAKLMHAVRYEKVKVLSFSMRILEYLCHQCLIWFSWWLILWLIY